MYTKSKSMSYELIQLSFNKSIQIYYNISLYQNLNESARFSQINFIIYNFAILLETKNAQQKLRIVFRIQKKFG